MKWSMDNIPTGKYGYSFELIAVLVDFSETTFFETGSEIEVNLKFTAITISGQSNY